MLRASADKNDESIDLRAVGDETVDVGLPGGKVISALVESAVLRDVAEMETSREQSVAALGEAATRRLIAVAANFEMMNRLLDAVGIGPPKQLRSIGEQIGVPLPERFA